jgi:radical SAM superfamily enzyme YgiQ (UPF0313 family)
MNVLLVNPRFPIAFYSLGELSSALGHKTTNPPLGLLTVAALLPPHWNLRLADENVREVSQEDFAFAHTVFIGAMLPQRDGALALVRAAKAQGNYVVAGGPYANSQPQELLDAGCDLVVRGEAELLVPELTEAVSARRQGAVIEAQTWPDLRNSPAPRYDLVNLDDYHAVSIQTSRGCPHDCEFCDVVNLNGRRPRCKKPEQVIAELEALFRLGWRGSVLICDDNFVGNRDHARSLLPHMITWSKAHGEPFFFVAQASIELARNKELIDLMTEANIGEVFIGVETPDEDLLLRCNKGHNVKNPLADSLRFINQNGMLIQCSFIIGLDGEKPGAGEKIAAFAQELGMPQVMLNMLIALPGTTLWRRLTEAGRLAAHFDTQDCLYGLSTNIVLDRPLEQVAREFVSAITRLYRPENYLDRAFRHIMRMRPTRAALGLAHATSARTTEPRARATEQAFREIKLLAAFLWRHGVASEYRMQFWHQFLTVALKHRSRLRSYIALCIKCGIYAEFAKRSRARAVALGLAPATD